MLVRLQKRTKNQTKYRAVCYFFKIEIQTEMILAESETYSTVLVQCTVHDHRSMYIRTYIYPYTRTYEFPFIFKKLLMTINNDKYVHTYARTFIHTYIWKFIFVFNIINAETQYTHINTYIHIYIYTGKWYIHIYIILIHTFYNSLFNIIYLMIFTSLDTQHII